MVSERDQRMLDWLQMFRMATTEQICKFGYDGNSNVCYKRLRRLFKDGLVKREKNTIGLGWVYSTSRIRTLQQAKHNFIRNEFYLNLIDIAQIKECMVEKVYGSVRPDATIWCTYKGKSYFFFLEVETNANRHNVNIEKYNEFFLQEWREYFKFKPTIIYVTDKDIVDEAHFKYNKINTKLDDFLSIFN